MTSRSTAAMPFSSVIPTGVRLSTMHSAKGLEFPVVFLLLPVVTGDKAVDDEEAVARMRNLVYVSLTRAMDNLQVFTTKAAVEVSDPADQTEKTDPRQVITEVVDCFHRFQSED